MRVLGKSGGCDSPDVVHVHVHYLASPLEGVQNQPSLTTITVQKPIQPVDFVSNINFRLNTVVCRVIPKKEVEQVGKTSCGCGIKFLGDS